MTLFEYFGVFFAIYGLFWFVFALAPVHQLRERHESATPGDWQHTETLIEQQFASVKKKRAA